VPRKSYQQIKATSSRIDTLFPPAFHRPLPGSISLLAENPHKIYRAVWIWTGAEKARPKSEVRESFNQCNSFIEPEVASNTQVDFLPAGQVPFKSSGVVKGGVKNMRYCEHIEKNTLRIFFFETKYLNITQKVANSALFLLLKFEKL